MAVAKKEGSLSKKEENKNETYSARRREELHVNIFFFFLVAILRISTMNMKELQVLILGLQMNLISR